MNPNPTKKPSSSTKAGIASASIPKQKPKIMIASHDPTITSVLKV